MTRTGTGGTQPSHTRARAQQPEENNGESEIAGQDLEETLLGEDFNQKLFETLSHEKRPKTRRDHRNRIKRIIEFWKKQCTEFYNVAVRQNTIEEMNNPHMWFFNGDFTEDLFYDKLNFKFVAMFLLDQKIVKTGKKKGKFVGSRNMGKFRDAIKAGAKLRNEKIPDQFMSQMDQHLEAYKKEHSQEKQKGNTESKDADPITFELYRLLLKWAAEDGNIFVFFWTLTQWNCMSRCASIAPLGFQNMKVAMDAHSVEHSLTKADQTGERCFAKNIFANSNDWLLCQWTGMALFCALNDKSFEGDTNNKFFWMDGTDAGSAAKKISRTTAWHDHKQSGENGCCQAALSAGMFQCLWLEKRPSVSLYCRHYNASVHAIYLPSR